MGEGGAWRGGCHEEGELQGPMLSTGSIGVYRGWQSVCWGGAPYFRLINVIWYLPSPYYRLFNVLWYLPSPYYRLFNVLWNLPSPYYRLFYVLWLPFLKIKKFRDHSFKIRKFRVESCSCFLTQMKFISKLLWILLMENESFSIPHLRKIWFTKYILKK